MRLMVFPNLAKVDAMFNARDLNIENPIISHAQRDQYNNSNIINVIAPDSAEATLGLLNPAARNVYHVPRCMEGTRENVLNKIIAWLDGAYIQPFQLFLTTNTTIAPDSESTPNVLWISGHPGAGKSAIASSLVSRLTQLNRLGSYFFFKRGDANLGNPAALWRTVAYDLAQFRPTIKPSLIKSLNRPGFRDGDILLHFDMIENVLRTHLSEQPFVIVIDALDECGLDGSPSAQRRNLLDTLTSWPRLPRQFKLIVTSRDERVPNFFYDPQHSLHITLETGDVTDPETRNDIRTFFRQQFANIVPNLGLPLSWPGEDKIEQLTHRAAGLFIWAQTAMSFMEEGWCDPAVKLDLVLTGNLGTMNENIDMLYRHILDYSFRDADGATLVVLRAAVGAIIVAKAPLHSNDLKYFATLLGNEEWRLNAILLRLSSVICMNPLLRIRHLSFAEFLTDPDRCHDVRFFIDKGKQHRTMSDVCMLIMKQNLRFNICRLESSYFRNDEISDLPERITKFIPNHLSYSCRFWVDHLSDTTTFKNTQDIGKDINEFLRVYFLYWLEIMSIIKEVPQSRAALATLIPLIKVCALSSTVKHSIKYFVGLGHRFVQYLCTRERCLQIYIYILQSHFPKLPPHLPVSTPICTREVARFADIHQNVPACPSCTTRQGFGLASHQECLVWP
jgi:NACHT domain